MNGRIEHEAVGQRLRTARETLGLTQEDVASALGIPRTSVIGMEAGKRNVTALELRRLARLYRRDVAWLIGETPEETTDSTAEAQALFRATAELSVEDKEQVLRFAQFLAAANPPSGKSTHRQRAAKRSTSQPPESNDGRNN